MLRILITLVLFSIFSVFPFSASAAPIINTQITNPSPPDIYPNTPNITVEITSNENSFNPNVGYSFNVHSLRNKQGCFISHYSKNPIAAPVSRFEVTSNKIIVSWNQISGGCMAEEGSYTFEIWAGMGSIDRNSISLIGNALDYSIQQPGGGEPKLAALEQQVAVGENPIVVISNARAGNSYTFWWDVPYVREIANVVKASDSNLRNGILTVNLDSKGSDHQAGKQSKICMEIGDKSSPIGLTCRYHTFFDIVAIPPDRKNITCSILPSITPTINDDVNLKINNAITGKKFLVNIKTQGTDFKTMTSDPVDLSRTIIIPIGSKLAKSSYTVQVIDVQAADPLVCARSFSTGDRDTASNVEDICRKDAKLCTSGGGKLVPDCSDSRDPKNPGIATAIGCIHTNPAEFVKDILKFLLGISGGLAFLMMLLGAFQMLTSGGNPETLAAGQGRLTSAVIGLLFIIFSVLFMQIIGADILNLEGFK